MDELTCGGCGTGFLDVSVSPKVGIEYCCRSPRCKRKGQWVWVPNELDPTEVDKYEPLTKWATTELNLVLCDDRYHYEAAIVQVNAPLALIQVEMKARAISARKVMSIIVARLLADAPLSRSMPDKT